MVDAAPDADKIPVPEAAPVPEAVPVPDADTVADGVNGVGMPLVASILLMLIPNGMVLGEPVCVIAGNVASTPEGTVSTVVKTAVTFGVDCNEAGQFIKPAC